MEPIYYRVIEKMVLCMLSVEPGGGGDPGRNQPEDTRAAAVPAAGSGVRESGAVIGLLGQLELNLQ